MSSTQCMLLCSPGFSPLSLPFLFPPLLSIPSPPRAPNPILIWLGSLGEVLKLPQQVWAEHSSRCFLVHFTLTQMLLVNTAGKKYCTSNGIMASNDLRLHVAFSKWLEQQRLFVTYMQSVTHCYCASNRALQMTEIIIWSVVQIIVITMRFHERLHRSSPMDMPTCVLI